MKWTPLAKRWKRLAPAFIRDVEIKAPKWTITTRARVFQITGGRTWSLSIIVFDGRARPEGHLSARWRVPTERAALVETLAQRLIESPHTTTRYIRCRCGWVSPSGQSSEVEFMRHAVEDLADAILDGSPYFAPPDAD